MLITKSTEIGFSDVAHHLEHVKHVMISGEGGGHVLKHEKSIDSYEKVWVV